jgi:putative ABC transport system permease protein
MGLVVSEVRHAIRLLARQRSFTITALATIAVAIAANTLIFALVRGILLRPLPVHQPDRLVLIEQMHQTGPSHMTGATFVDLHARTRTLQSLAALRIVPASVSDEAHAVQASAAIVTADYFTALQAGPVRGRVFARADFVTSAEPVVIVSGALWRRMFNGDPAVIGRPVLVNAARRRLVGVVDLPASIPGTADLWLPFPDDSPLFRNRRAQLLTVVGRLADITSAAAATSELDAVSADIRRSDPSAGALQLRATLLSDRIVQSIRPTLLVLWGAVFVLLAVGFANVANLVLVQGSVRARETSIRAALGASSWRLVREGLIESVILGVAGGGLGTLLGAWAVPIVRQLLPAGVPRATDVAVDPSVVAYGISISIACAILFGTFPALRASGRHTMDALRGREPVAGSSRLRDGLVASEVALTMILLAGAGLAGRTLLSVSQVSLGFDPRSVVTMELSLPAARYDGVVAQRQFYQAVLDRLAAVPGVTSAGVSGALPLTPTAATGMEPQDGIENTQPSADVITATPALFTALRVPLVRGRLFEPGDRTGAAPVALVSEKAAREFWPAGADPIGRAITMHDWGPPYRATVIGIVGDVHQAGPDQPVSPAVYYPFAQFPETTLVQSVVVRTNQPADRIISSIRDVVRSVDRNQPIGRTATMEDRLSGATAQRRINLLLLGAFALAALLMAGVGVYGVVAFAMASRTREIGVRMALGATRRDIAMLGTLRGAGPVLVGLGIGIGGALLSGRAIEGVLFGVTSRDPSTLTTAAVVVLLVALAAVAGPMRRAMRIDPLDALRVE